jgi:hypothetical protein
MRSVSVPPVDYAANHAEAITRGDVPEGTVAPVVRRFTDVELIHSPGCGLKFLASFDEVQRILVCPECGGETTIPPEYRGLL